MNVTGSSIFSLDPIDYLDTIVAVLDMRYSLAQHEWEVAGDHDTRVECDARLDELAKILHFVSGMRDCVPPKEITTPKPIAGGDDSHAADDDN